MGNLNDSFVISPLDITCKVKLKFLYFLRNIKLLTAKLVMEKQILVNSLNKRLVSTNHKISVTGQLK